MDTTELPRLPCPFDGSAHARQIRMGLLNSLGVPDQDVIAVLSRVHAAMFYDKLWDIFEDGEQVFYYCQQITELQQEQDFHVALLSICSIYETLGIQIPDAVEWFTDYPDLSASYVPGFVRRIVEFQGEAD